MRSAAVFAVVETAGAGVYPLMSRCAPRAAGSDSGVRSEMKCNWKHQLLAVLAVGVITAIRLALDQYGLTDLSRFLLYALGVVIAAWFGGFLAGLNATLLSMLAVSFFFLEPRMSLRVINPLHGVPMAVFLVQGLLISWLGQTRLRAIHELKMAQSILEGRVELRTAQLRSVNERLQSEALERERSAAELSATAERLRTSNRELESFASVASHDLQEPLRKIQAFGDRLESKFGATLGADGADYLRRMKAAAGRMQRLINDLLTFSRVTTQAQPFQAIDLNEVVHDVLIDLENRLETSGGTVRTSPLPTVEADPMQMRQLFQNLLSNALKFAREGVNPQVTVTSLNEQGAGDGAEEPAFVRIAVSDNGIGFDEKYLDRIFDVFQRLHGRGTYEGTGIGLAVCRKIVERHGGEITAHSTLGEGSRFIITLPRVQPQERKELHASADADHHLVG
jgi:signal transduction histidine kinase